MQQQYATIEISIQQALDSIDPIKFRAIVNQPNQINIHLVDSIRYLVNDPHKQLDSDQILDKLYQFKNMQKFKNAILNSKSSCLRYVLNVEHKNQLESILHLMVVQIIEYIEFQQMEQYYPKRNTLKSPEKQQPSSPKSTISHNSSIFKTQPKYFNHSSTKESANFKLLQKEKQLNKLQQLKQQQDEYERYRLWQIQQQEFKAEQKQKVIEERQRSREVRHQILISHSPRIRKEQQSTSNSHKSEYDDKIQVIQMEIKYLQQQLIQ